MKGVSYLPSKRLVRAPTATMTEAGGRGAGLLQGRVAFITGAGSGIGRSTCVAMAREGARLALADINEAAVAETLSLLPSERLDGPAHLPLRLDVTDEAAVERAVCAVRDHFGQPADVVVNSAGIMGPLTELLDLDVQVLRDAYKINVEGTFLVMRAFARALKEAQRGGAVVNLSSVGRLTCFPRRGHYAATKGAVSVLTQTASREWAPLGIRCNSVLPGLVDTPMTQEGAPAGAREQAVKHITALGRMAKPEEIAEVIVFLASDRSSYMTGAEVPVSGGIFGGT